MADQSETIRAQLPQVAACSEFIARAVERQPDMLSALIDEGYVTRPREPGSVRAALLAAVMGCDDEVAIMRVLRQWRRRELARIAWRDITGASGVEESLSDLSALADAAVECAADFAWRGLTQRYGVPRSEAGAEQPLVILGMGKLGGGELNFSSDIDLVFLFPEAGDTDGRRPISNEEFFTRMGRGVIRLLDAVTEDGFVYRVDMRLRPFGDSGPLAVSFSFFENYLQQHGRDWERYAYVKARALTGKGAFDELYRDTLRPFVYRRYLDFGVFEALREMKALIAREVERRELEQNLKLGPGGIREIEFIVQAYQLLRGGRDRRLQSQSLLEVLPLLAGEKLLPDNVVSELKDAYLYLRRLENRLQMIGDQQTHTLPDDARTRGRVLMAMGLARSDAPLEEQSPAMEKAWSALIAQLERHRVAVTRNFNAVVFGSGATEAPVVDMEALWDAKRQMPAVREGVAGFGFSVSGTEAIASALAEWRESSFVQKLDDVGRRRLQALVPKLLGALKKREEEGAAAIATLRRVLQILESLGRRSSYLALLNESPQALGRLVDICARSEFLTRQIADFPLLLDELVDTRTVEALPTRAQFAEELALRRAQQPDADPEQQVEALRQFQRAAIFRVALADLTGRLPLMQVSDRLTDIAELIVGQAATLAWEQITQLHGVPTYDGNPVRFAVVAYGKLGSIELGYASDLDLVFLHDSHGEVQKTNGAKPVDNAVFFLRLGQRIIHLLTMHSAAGRLYEVDTRLRPSGKGGMMVTQVDAFESYQKTEAWTWEHQSLLRARAVAGSGQLRRRFEEIRTDVLSNHIRRDTLCEDVRKMRERMRAELSSAKAGEFDIKQDHGGIADIEFLAQYWALAWAQKYPPVAMFSDTIRQLESVASADLVPQSTIDVLTGAYRDYRAEIHHLSLENKPAVVSAEQFARQRGEVSAIWDRAFAANPPAS